MMAWAGSWLAVALLGLAEPERLERYDFTEKHMGVPVKIVLYAPDEAAANAAAQAAYARFAQLDKVLSDYDPESELMRLCRRAGTPEPTPVSGDLWKVLRRSQELARATDGAFDVTVGPLVRLWRRSRREKELPSPKLLAEALAATGFESLVLHEDARAVALLKPGMRLDLGGIGMGYAVDEAMQVLEHHGIRRALIDASGDILASAPPP
ncbi:MAG: FAD:protein FMN transferase, partial [Planctomycetaceae bacterium]|nr:FAD:protein FMN transferase [Planctomycetaceae bacterium]